MCILESHGRSRRPRKRKRAEDYFSLCRGGVAALEGGALSVRRIAAVTGGFELLFQKGIAPLGFRIAGSRIGATIK